MTLSGNQGVKVSINEKKQGKEPSLFFHTQTNANYFRNVMPHFKQCCKAFVYDRYPQNYTALGGAFGEMSQVTGIALSTRRFQLLM